MSFNKFKDGRFDLIGLIKGTNKYQKNFELYSKVSRISILQLHIFMSYIAIWLIIGTLSIIFPQLRIQFDLITIPIINDVVKIMDPNPLILFGSIAIIFMIHEIGHAISAIGLKKEVPYILCVGVFDKYFPVIATNIKGEEKEFTNYELLSIYNGGNLAVFIAFFISMLAFLLLGPIPILSTFAFSALAILSFNVFPLPGTDAWQIIRAKLQKTISNQKGVV